MLVRKRKKRISLGASTQRSPSLIYVTAPGAAPSTMTQVNSLLTFKGGEIPGRKGNTLYTRSFQIQ